MFKRLAKSGLTGFWPVQRQRIALRPHQAGPTHSNDNLPGFRRPKGQRRIPSPTLACHWINRNGRLECRWQTEPAAPAAREEADCGPANDRTFRPKAISLAHRRDLSGLALTIPA
jgi:hypothetical protein